MFRVSLKRASAALAMLFFAGCVTLAGLSQYDTEEQRAWEEASLFMFTAYRNLDDDMDRVTKIQTIIDTGERYITKNYPQFVGYLALSESLAEVYSRKFLDEGYKPRLRFIYTVVMEYLTATSADVPLDLDELERRALLDMAGASLSVLSD